MTTRFPRPTKSRRRAGNGSRQAFAVVTAIAAMLALGALATDRYEIAAKRHVTGKAEASNGEGIYTGSILYMPDTSNVCHQWLFDNRNGQFTDNGSVDCERAAYQGLDGPKQWSAARIKVISTGFRDH